MNVLNCGSSLRSVGRGLVGLVGLVVEGPGTLGEGSADATVAEDPPSAERGTVVEARVASSASSALDAGEPVAVEDALPAPAEGRAASSAVESSFPQAVRSSGVISAASTVTKPMRENGPTSGPRVSGWFVVS
jgi:hypothetical protein